MMLPTPSHPADDAMAALYVPTTADFALFQNYRPPARFEHGRWYPVAEFPPVSLDDGLRTFVLECRMPARFYRIDALDPKTGAYVVRLATGSGESTLAAHIACALSQGMLALYDESLLEPS